ncbi:MAG: SDR family oxidoreductase [Pseudomonadota bacterium]
MTRKIVAVTGANRGIGLAIAKALHSEGYAIAAMVRSSSDELDALIDGDEASAQFDLDLSDAVTVAETTKTMLKWARTLHGLVNCAGTASGGLFTMTSADDLRAMFEVNVVNQVQIMQLAARKMIRAKAGSIVNIASTAGLLSDPGTLSYGASKAALIHATRVAAAELGPYNIRANAIAPAVVDTDMAAQMDDAAREKLEARSALPGPTAPEDVAGLVSYLMSDASRKLTGQVIRLDRGMPF